MKRLVIYSILILVGLAELTAQEIRVTALPDTGTIVIGDQTGFTVTADLPAGTVASLERAVDTLSGRLLILRRDPRDTILFADGMMTITDRYLITSFASGTYVIPPFSLEIVAGDSLLHYYSDYSAVTVLRPDIVLSDTTDVIFDIIPPRGAPVTMKEVVPWLAIILVSALIIWLLARYLPRNPLKRFVRPAPPPEPAHLIALRALRELREASLWQQGEIKEYYSRLSDILRRYIDNRYGISSPELTTGETVAMLSHARVTTPEQMRLVRELLSLSDMVKFARYRPDNDTNELSVDQAVSFVTETREAEEEAEADKKNEEKQEQEKEREQEQEKEQEQDSGNEKGEGSDHA